jgi:hypothetical protein
MKVAEQIREKIKSIPESEPFGYADLGVDKKDFFSAAKSLRLVCLAILTLWWGWCCWWVGFGLGWAYC